jgi:hypothetical protein
MPWFRLEDSFYNHPKVRRAGNAGAGLWVRCGTWSAAYLTDGHVPLEVAQDFGTRREIAALTAARLWVPVDDELVIADWLDYQPSALEIKERRKRDAERKRRGREAVDRDSATGQWASRRGQDPFA